MCIYIYIYAYCLSHIATSHQRPRRWRCPSGSKTRSTEHMFNAAMPPYHRTSATWLEEPNAT